MCYWGKGHEYRNRKHKEYSLLMFHLDCLSDLTPFLLLNIFSGCCSFVASAEENAEAPDCLCVIYHSFILGGGGGGGILLSCPSLSQD